MNPFDWIKKATFYFRLQRLPICDMNVVQEMQAQYRRYQLSSDEAIHKYEATETLTLAQTIHGYSKENAVRHGDLMSIDWESGSLSAYYTTGNTRLVRIGKSEFVAYSTSTTMDRTP